jgi:ubiquinone biosynthesis monooxygenase Coq7
MDYLPGDKKPKEILAEILRVNHSGELGAKHIYEGQLTVFQDDKNIKEMLDQELEHLEYFENKLVEYKVRPSIFTPIWKLGAKFLGVATSKVSKETAMLCTESVEDVIDNHYKEQIYYTNHISKELSDKIEQFRQEEVHHKNTAINLGSKNSVLYNMFYKTISIITKTAINIAKKY